MSRTATIYIAVGQDGHYETATEYDMAAEQLDEVVFQMIEIEVELPDPLALKVTLERVQPEPVTVTIPTDLQSRVTLK